MFIAEGHPPQASFDWGGSEAPGIKWDGPGLKSTKGPWASYLLSKYHFCLSNGDQ